MAWRLLKKPYEILPGVYDITVRRESGRRYRSYLLTKDVPTLVDTCHDQTKPKENLIAGISRIGIEPDRLFITHGDPDHIGGFDSIVEQYDVETWVPKETELDSKNQPDHRYRDEDQVGPCKAIHVPGHEDDSYALVNEKDDFAIMGDTVVGADIRGLPQGYFSIHTEELTHDVRAAERNLSKLFPYTFEAGLVFHGTSVLENASEKLETYVDGPKKDR